MQIISPSYLGHIVDTNCVLGITVGAVVIPQGMAYAKLAQLPVEFGLYSSFMGVACYWFFATSKDITIGVGTIQKTSSNIILTDLFFTSLLPSCRLLLETSSQLQSLSIRS